MKYHTVITLGYHTLVLSNYLGRVVGGGGRGKLPMCTCTAKCKPGVNLVQVSATHLMVVDVGPGVPDSLQLKQGHSR